MTGAFGLIVGLTLPAIAGYQLADLLLRQERAGFALKLSLGYGLGLGILSYVMLAIGILGFIYKPLTVATGMLIVCILLFVIKARATNSTSRPVTVKMRQAAAFSNNKLPWIVGKWLIYGFIVYYLIYIFWAAWNLPVYTWDSVATSFYNSKILVFERTLSAQQQFKHLAYPPQFPLIMTWLTLNIGAWNETLMKTVFPLAFIGFIVIFYSFVKEMSTSRKALLGVFLIFASNFAVFHATISYRDIFMMYYFCSAVFCVVFWRRTTSACWLILAGFLCGFGAFMKLEGTAYILITAVLVVLPILWDKKSSVEVKINDGFSFLLPAVGLWGIYAVYKWIVGFPLQEYVEIDFINAYSRWPKAVGSFVDVMFFTANAHITWFVLLYVLAIQVNTLRKDAGLQTLLGALLLFGGLHFSLGVISGKGDHILSIYTLSRLILHAYPLAVALIVIPLDGFGRTQGEVS